MTIRTVVGIAGGLGNSVFNLPLIKALRELGHDVVGCVDTDYPSEKLWSRCVYLDRVVGVQDPLPDADHYLSGPWTPKPMRQQPSRLRRYTWAKEPEYPEPEWSLTLQAARDLGWTAGGRPDVSDWCREVDRTPRWDVGFAPGCKPAAFWERKRYPWMVEVAEELASQGNSIATFGTDRDPALPGEDLRGRYTLDSLPDALAGCRIVVGVDGGVTHLASSLGIPVVVVYTATNEVKGSPVGPRAEKIFRQLPCRPCQLTPRWKECRDWICRDIDPKEVVSRAEGLLA